MATEFLRRLRAAPKNRALWEEMYRTLRPIVYRTAYRLLHGEVALAEDVTQEAFLRFLQYGKLSTLESDDHLLAYLRQTTRHLCWDRLRQASRTVSLGSPEGVQALEQTVVDSEEVDQLSWDIEHLAGSLSDEEQRLLRELITNTSLNEIAEALGITYGAAAVRIHRLRGKLHSAINGL